MKKLIPLIPCVFFLSGCLTIPPELEEFNKQHEKMLQDAGLIGESYVGGVFPEIWYGTSKKDCGIEFKTEWRSLDGLVITGSSVSYFTNPEKCEPYLSNLKYYIKHGKTKAQQERDDAWEQKRIQQRQERERQAKEDEAYAKEQYRLAKQSKNSSDRINHLENASIYGNAQASYELFRHYLPVDEYLAEQYLKKAAFDGHATANIIMGGRFAKSARYHFSDNIHAYVFYKRAQRYGSKEAATLAKGIENRFKARIQQGSEEAEYLWRNAQRAASF